MRQPYSGRAMVMARKLPLLLPSATHVRHTLCATHSVGPSVVCAMTVCDT